MASFSVLTAFWIIKTSQVNERSKEEKQAKWREAKRTAAAVFFRTFGVLLEVHFLHTIYHFKALEVKNPTLQTMHDLELKWGRYGLRKTTAPGLCEIRTTPSGCAKLVRNSHNTFKIRTIHAWCEFSSVFADSTLDLFLCIFFYVISFLILVTSQSQAFAFIKTI